VILGAGWLALRPAWLALKPAWLALRPDWLALRPAWLGLRPAWLALGPLRGGTNGWTNGRTDEWMNRRKIGAAAQKGTGGEKDNYQKPIDVRMRKVGR